MLHLDQIYDGLKSRLPPLEARGSIHPHVLNWEQNLRTKDSLGESSALVNLPRTLDYSLAKWFLTSQGFEVNVYPSHNCDTVVILKWLPNPPETFLLLGLRTISYGVVRYRPGIPGAADFELRGQISRFITLFDKIDREKFGYTLDLLIGAAKCGLTACFLQHSCISPEELKAYVDLGIVVENLEAGSLYSLSWTA